MNFVAAIPKMLNIVLLSVSLTLIAFVLTACDIEVDREPTTGSRETSNQVNVGDDNLGFTESVFQGEP